MFFLCHQRIYTSKNPQLSRRLAKCAGVKSSPLSSLAWPISSRLRSKSSPVIKGSLSGGGKLRNESFSWDAFSAYQEKEAERVDNSMVFSCMADSQHSNLDSLAGSVWPPAESELCRGLQSVSEMDQSPQAPLSNDAELLPGDLLPPVTKVLRTETAWSAHRWSLPFGASFLDGLLADCLITA